MSDQFNSIKQGLTQAIHHASGKPTKTVLHNLTPLDIKAIRAKVGMSQPEFAAAFGVGLGTIRHWERGDRTPKGPALALLNVISKAPEAVLKALRE